MVRSRRNQPSNVVALSPYRARLGRGRQLRRADALLDAPDLELAVRALPGDELYYVLHEIGLQEGAAILARASAEQVQTALDFALWERDQLGEGQLAEWLSALATAPYERVGEWLAGLDTELVALILRRGAQIYDVGEEGPPEEPEGTFFPTPDGLFVLDVRTPAAPSGDGIDPVRALIQLVDSGYRADKNFMRRLLVGARGELDAELEEAAYRWRQARMADLGFADYYEALEVYRELDPAGVRLAEGEPGRGPSRTVVDARAAAEGTALRVPTALAERLSDAEGSPFSRAAQRLAAGDEVEELRFELVALTNRVLTADRVTPGNDEAVAAVLDRLVSTLDLAIERLAQGDDARGALALRTIPLVRLHRLGVSLCGKVKRLAMTLRRSGPLGPRGFEIAEADDAAVLEAVTRLRPMFPRLLDEPPVDGERPFESLADLARAGAAVEEAAAAQALVRGLGVSPADLAPGGSLLEGTTVDEATLDLGLLARTALVRRLLDASREPAIGGAKAAAARPFAPLEPADVRAFEALLGTTPGGPPRLPVAIEKKAKAILLAAAPPTLAAAAAVAERWIAGLAPLEPVLVNAPAPTPAAARAAAPPKPSVRKAAPRSGAKPSAAKPSAAKASGAKASSKKPRR
jgi:Family of unknown function (DUF6178)